MESMGKAVVAVAKSRTVSPHLLSDTLRGLNNSFGKIIISCLQLNLGSGRLMPVAKILFNTFSGITLNQDKWIIFKSDFLEVTNYCETWGSEAERICGTRVEFSSYYRLLTSCYQKRAVCFGAVGRKCKEDRKVETFGEPAAKRQCGYSPCIFLQQSIFEKLVEVSRCVDYHLAFLQNNEEIINRCMDTVISYFRGELGNNHEISGMPVQAFLATDEAKDKLLCHLQSVMMNEHPDFVNNLL